MFLIQNRITKNETSVNDNFDATNFDRWQYSVLGQTLLLLWYVLPILCVRFICLRTSDDVQAWDTKIALKNMVITFQFETETQLLFPVVF